MALEALKPILPSRAPMENPCVPCAHANNSAGLNTKMFFFSAAFLPKVSQALLKKSNNREKNPPTIGTNVQGNQEKHCHGNPAFENGWHNLRTKA